MALDLEEQEQLAEMKAWWRQHGGLIILVITAAAILYAGWTGWQWYKRTQALQAATLYEVLVKSVQAGDPKVVRDAGGTLVENYPRTLYAPMGALVVARFYFDRKELRNARAQLQWVVEHSRLEEFRDIARLRLAAILLDEKAYDEGIKVLQAAHSPAFDARYAAMQGDLFTARGKNSEAKAAYQLALKKAPDRDSAFTASIRMRLDALGG